MSTESPFGTAAAVEDLAASRRRRWITLLIVAAVFLGLALFGARFYKQTFAGLRNRHAADLAQISRNVADGRGFTTRWIRPFSVTLVPPFLNDVPEVNSAPLYPYIVAGLFKLRSPSEQVVAWASLLSLGATLFVTYLLGWVLFNWRVGLLAAAAIGVNAEVLRVGVSGLEWPIAALWLTSGLVAIALHHSACARNRMTAAVCWAAVAGVSVVLLYLTHHLLIALVVPLAVYFAATRTVSRWHLVVFLVVVAVLAAPWAYRNMSVARFPVIGANAWDVMADTGLFAGDNLYRTTDSAVQNPFRVLAFPFERFSDFAHKLLTGSADALAATAAMLGLAVLPFAVVGTLYRFKQHSANAVRALAYGMAAVLIPVIGLFSMDRGAVLLLAPVASVLASAYFFLLLDAKRLHPFFQRSLLVGFILVSCAQAVPAVFYPQREPVAPEQQAIELYFGNLGTKGAFRVYTDQPWLAGWRTQGYGVWLPRADSDVYALESKGFPLEAVVLSRESGTYSENEIWYQLHRSRGWRDYLVDPERAATRILKDAGIDDKTAPLARKYLQRLRRQFAVSESIAGLTVQKQDPLAPDDVQVFLLQEAE